MTAASNHFILPALTLSRRELVRFIRQRSRMIGVIGSPLVFWFLIGSGLGGSFRHPQAPPEVSYLEYFYPGTIVLIILFSSIFSSISIIEDRKEGFLQSVLVAPVSRSSIALGKILGSALLSLAQGVLLLFFAPFVGIVVNPLMLLTVVAVLVLLSFGLSGLGFLIAWRMDSTQGFHAIMNLFLIPMWLLSGALFPLSGAASWLGTVMAINPLTYGVAALRHALYAGTASTTQDFASFTSSFLVTAAFAVGTFFLSSIIVSRPGRN